MTDTIPSFKEAFAKVLEHAGLVYDGHIDTKRDTWKDMDIEDLEGMLQKEIEEYHAEFSTRGMFGESLDIVNFAIMIAARRLKMFEDTQRWQTRMRDKRPRISPAQRKQIELEDAEAVVAEAEE